MGSKLSLDETPPCKSLIIARRGLLVHSSAVQDTLTIRIDATLKQEAEKKAALQDETLSQVVRRALRDYVSERRSRGKLTPKTNSRR